MNTLRILTAACALALAGAAAGQAQACGEVMYRMGGALRYQAFVTHHPAEILVYDGPASRQHDKGKAQEATEFGRNLERGGHKVTVVTDGDALAQALAARRYDIIIAYAGDLPDITARLDKRDRAPTMIPVIDRNAADERALRSHYPGLVNEDASFGQMMKSIEQSMKARGS